MKKSRPNLLLCGLLLLHFAALYTFTKGFLTTRLELPHHSHCSDFRNGQVPAATECWSTSPKLPVQKVVVLIVDALRADFFYEPVPKQGQGGSSPAAADIIRDYDLHMPRLHGVVRQAVRVKEKRESIVAHRG